MSRGAIISMFVVILLLPAVLKVFDKLIIHSTAGFKDVKEKEKAEKAKGTHVNMMA